MLSKIKIWSVSPNHPSLILPPSVQKNTHQNVQAAIWLIVQGVLLGILLTGMVLIAAKMYNKMFLDVLNMNQIAVSLA